MRKKLSLVLASCESSRLVARRVFCVLMVMVLAGLTASLTVPLKTSAATNSTINFQARLESSTGAVVPDGTYNLQFKLYSAASGGSALWTETYLNSASEGVQLINGYLSVNLGEADSFPSNINWDQELWLTMNVGGSGGSASWDGEMNPRLKVTALPYAFRAGQLAKTTGADTSVLDWATQTGANSLLLPDASGTLCVQSSTACGFAPASGSANYINNSTSVQTANFNVQSAASGSVGGVIRAASGQTANLLEFQNSSGGVLSSFAADGTLTIGRVATGYNGVVVATDSIQHYYEGNDSRFMLSSNTSYIHTDLSGQDHGGLLLGNGSTTATKSLIASGGSGNARLDFYTGGNFATPALKIDSSGNSLFTTRASGSTVLTVKAAASQTADLLQLQNSSGTVLTRIYANGNIGTEVAEYGKYENRQDTAAAFIGSSNGTVFLNPGSGSNDIFMFGNTRFSAGRYLFSEGNNSLVVRANSGQTADILQLQDNSGTILTAFQADGKLVFGPSGSQDANLYRDTAGILKTNSSLRLDGQVYANVGTANQVALGYTGVATGPGLTFGSANDTNLYRSAANTLKTDGSLTVGTSNTSTLLVGGASSGSLTLTSSGASASIRNTNNTSGSATLSLGAGAGTSDIRLNGTAGDGTGGVVFYSGGATPQQVAKIDSSGTILLGSSGDTNLYRLSAARLRTDGDLEANVGYIGSRASGGGLISLQGQDTGYQAIKSTGGIEIVVNTPSSPYTALSIAGTGEVGFGIVPTASAGILQLASGTTAAYGIKFSTDTNTNLYRSASNTLQTDGQFNVGQMLTVANNNIQIGTVGPSSKHALKIGPGSGDVNLYRDASDVLRTDDAFTVDGVFTKNGNSGTSAVIDADAYLHVTGGSGSGVIRATQNGSGYSSGNAAITAASTNTTQIQNAYSAVLNGTASWNLDFNGVQTWGGDTNLYRTANSILKTDDLFSAQQGVIAFSGDAAQIKLTNSGRVAFGTAEDTTIYREAANTLKTDSSFHVQTNTNSTMAFRVQDAAGASKLTVDNTSTELAVNGGAETSASFATNWAAFGTSTVTRTTTSGEFISGTAAVKAAATAGNSGAKNNLGSALATSTLYNVSFTAKSSTSMTDLTVAYYRSGSTSDAVCSSYSSQAIGNTDWKKISCSFTTTSTAGDSTASVAVYQVASTTRDIFIDNMSIISQNVSGGLNVSQVRIGGLNGQGLTLLTADSYANAPNTNAVINPALYGSMYYDTTLGKMQCYEGTGWGFCGVSPDVSVNLIPEYVGMVLNGTGIGTLTSNLCSGTSKLSINTSTCSASEDYNYYQWTSPQATDQTYNLYVRYQLPATFKNFSDTNTITLTGRTSSTTDGSVAYTMYKPDGSLCGTATTVTTSANTWQTVALSGNETTCSLNPNDIIMFKINVTAKNNANVYVSNLSFLTKGK